MKAEAYQIMGDCEQTYWWYRVRRTIIADQVQRFVAAGSDVLDFGCGNGAMAEFLTRAGYGLTVTDRAESARASCRARQLAVLEPEALGERRDDGFDCILACDVLEHVDDDLKVLQELYDLLRPGGMILVTVPAYEFLWSGEDYVSEHMRRYTRNRLAEVVRSAGLELVWDSHFNTVLFPAIAAAIFWKRLVRPREMYRSNVQPLPRWLDTFLGRLFSFERRCLTHLRFPFGMSLIAIGQRTGV